MMLAVSISQRNNNALFHSSFTWSGLISKQYFNSIIQFEKFSEIQKRITMCSYVSVFASICLCFLVPGRLPSSQQCLSPLMYWTPHRTQMNWWEVWDAVSFLSRLYDVHLYHSLFQEEMCCCLSAVVVDSVPYRVSTGAECSHHGFLVPSQLSDLHLKEVRGWDTRLGGPCILLTLQEKRRPSLSLVESRKWELGYADD